MFRRPLSPGGGVPGLCAVTQERLAVGAVLSAQPGSSCPADRLILAISLSAPGQPGFVLLQLLLWFKR